MRLNVSKLTEADVQNLIKLEFSNRGARVWRNNVGAVHTSDGRFIRFGLANESMAMNSKIKSADLIGIQPIRITQAHVGKIIGQFISREIKKPGWKYSGTGREKAQLAWMNLILSLGGDAAFENGDLLIDFKNS